MRRLYKLVSRMDLILKCIYLITTPQLNGKGTLGINGEDLSTERGSLIQSMSLHLAKKYLLEITNSNKYILLIITCRIGQVLHFTKFGIEVKILV